MVAYCANCRRVQNIIVDVFNFSNKEMVVETCETCRQIVRTDVQESEPEE